MTNKNRFTATWIYLIVFAIFSAALVIGKLVNTCFYLMLITAMALLTLQSDQRQDLWTTCKKYHVICLSMCATLVAVLIRQISQGELTVRLYDLPARLAVFAIIFWLVLKLPVAMLRKLKWGFIVGAIVYAIDLYIDTNGGAYRVSNINSFSVIFSSELALLLGMFAILSMGWSGGRSAFIASMQITAGIAGLFSVYLSQTRGAWVAIPFFALIGISTLMHGQRNQTKVLTYLGVLIAIVIAFSTTNIARERIADARNDIAEFAIRKNLDTSIGVRFQLWNASWMMFSDHPITGVGKEHFSDELHRLQQQGVVTELAAMQYHSHNELLYSMATLGIFGLFAVLITYLAPVFYFAKYMFHADAQIHATAAMGLCLCTGYIIFGLVDVMFGWNMCCVFYTMAIAVFMAYIANRNQELASS